MSKHSPGPWAWDFDQPYRTAVLVAFDGSEVLDLGGGMKWEEAAGKEPSEEDARLIAAAPRMRLLLAEGSAPNDNPWSHELWRRRVEALLAEIDGEAGVR